MVYIEDLTQAPAEGTEDTFSAPPEINEQSCGGAVRALEDAKVHLDKSSKCLMNCHSREKESSNKQFIRVRSELTTLATVYKDLHLPLATKVVTDLREAIMLHADCDIKEFKKNIRDIEQSMSEQAVSAALLTRANEILLSDLYDLEIVMGKEIFSINADAAKKQKDASNARENGKKEKEIYDAEAHDVGIAKVAFEYVGKAGLVAGAIGVGTVLAAGPVLVTAGAVGVIGGAVAGVGGFIGRKFAQDMEEEATANGDNAITEAKRAADEADEEALECFKAVKLIKEEMIDSLTQFIKAMEQVSPFLSKLSSETTSKWCVKHEASGTLQRREHSHLQGLLNSPENSRFDSTSKVATWLGLRQILAKFLRLCKKRRAASISNW